MGKSVYPRKKSKEGSIDPDQIKQMQKYQTGQQAEVRNRVGIQQNRRAGSAAQHFQGMSGKEKKHILVYGHYYWPDSASTGQLLQELAEGLLPQFKVTVICVVPSYLGTVEEKYKARKFYFENVNGVELIRVRVPEFSKTNKLSRIKNIITYFLRAVQATGKVTVVDYVMAISQPPILGGLLGAYGKKKHACSYIYHIQDCNPEQIMAVGYFKCKPFLRLLQKMDTFSCMHADLVVVPARDMVETIEGRFTKNPGRMPQIAVINNWIDDKKIYPLEPNHPKVEAFKKKYGLENKFLFCYSGNLGNYYSLPELLKVIQKFPAGTKTADGREVVFLFIGNGAQKENMTVYVGEHHMDNVRFLPYQDKEALIYSLNAADVHWCVNAKGIKGVSCPSKYYGIAAVGKPVLGVLEEGTEIRAVIEECGNGLVCEPGDYDEVERNLRWFIENAGSDGVRSMGEKGRVYLEENLCKEKSIGKFRDEIIGLRNVDEIVRNARVDGKNNIIS